MKRRKIYRDLLVPGTVLTIFLTSFLFSPGLRACFDLPPEPDPHECEWEPPDLAEGSVQSPVSLFTSSKVVTGSPPADRAENPGGLNLMIENAWINSSRVGYSGFNDPVDGQPATRYLDSMRVLSTDVRETVDGVEELCGSYQESVHRSINPATSVETEQTSLVSNPAFWLDGPVVSDTVRKNGAPGDDVKLTHTLSVPHTVDAFVSRTIAHDPFNGTFPHSTIGSPHYSMNSEKTSLGISKTRIKWRWGSTVPAEERHAPPVCIVRFSPPDDPGTVDVNESLQVEVVKTIFWDTWKTQMESPVYEIDPLLLKGHINGAYTVSFVSVKFVVYPKSVSGPLRAHLKNLTTQQNETAAYGMGWEKVASVVWSGTPLNLIDFLENGFGNHGSFEDAVEWTTVGLSHSGHEMSLGSNPSESDCVAVFVQVKAKGTAHVIDRLLITVVSTATKTKFDNWYLAFSSASGKAWLADLPPLPTHLDFSGATPLEPDRNKNPRMWALPGSYNGRRNLTAIPAWLPIPWQHL